MIIDKYYNILTNEQVEYLSKFSKECLYSSETQIIYANQIPMASYVLLAGKIILRDAQKRIVKTCQPKVLIGFSEFFHGKAYKYTVEIESGSKVLILDRSTILEIQNQNSKHSSEPFKFFEELTRSA